eukprot:scaffold113383_cov36-Phaeocystis_antarctica.AAC.1
MEEWNTAKKVFHEKYQKDENTVTLGIDAFNRMHYGINRGNWLNCVTGDSDKRAYIAPEIEPRKIDQASVKKTGQK